MVQEREQLDAERRFAGILAESAKLYKDKSGETLADFMSTQLRSVDQLKQELARQNNDFDVFRAKRQKIFDAVGAALKPVELIGEIASSAASEVFAPAQHIYTAVLFLVNAAKNVSAAYDTITELFEQLKVSESRAYPQTSTLCSLQGPGLYVTTRRLH